MTVIERLKRLGTLIKERNIGVYMTPTSDFYETKYVGEHFEARSFMSGFTGSTGTPIVCRDYATLWTDDRYFIQAANQLKDSTIDLVKQGEEDVPEIPAYIRKHIRENGVFGFDGCVMNARLIHDIMEELKDKDAAISTQEGLVGMIWRDRPPLPTKKGFFPEETYSGKSTKDRLAGIRTIMWGQNATHHIVTSLGDITWMVNMRGWGISYFPVMLCYLVITHSESYIFIDENKLDEQILTGFGKNAVAVHAYDGAYAFAETIPADAYVMLNTGVVSYAITQNLKKEIRIVDCPNPSQLMEARKNEIEPENNHRTHIKGTIVMTKFMYWLKNNIGKEAITEISASDYLESLRRKQEHDLGLNFSTTSIYKEHAAMIHYNASKETNVKLKSEGMLLVNSGGQYLEGTTDITRALVLEPISDKIHTYYACVLCDMIQPSRARFLEDCHGMNLDILVRGPLWEMGTDYKYETGHGAGYLMNVHEGPSGFRWKMTPERNDSYVLEEGMTQSNEPDVYMGGSHDIRHENRLVVRGGKEDEYGQFMYFETITFIPFDLDGPGIDLMTRYDIAWLNAYHKKVYDKVSPYLSEAEKEWLRYVTREI